MKNLNLRIISSFFLIIFFFSLSNNEELLFNFAIHFLISFALWEFIRLTSFRPINKSSFANNNFFLSRHRIDFFDYFLIIFLNFLCFILLKKIFYLFILFSVLLIFFFYSQKINLKKIFGIIYISSSIFFLILLNHDQNYKVYIFFIIFYSITTDISSFFTGKFFGGPKLAPKISPGKTISGSLGGIFIPTLISLIFLSDYQSSILLITFTSILFSIIVQIGDLIESYYKRLCYIKESSNLIPGHGGVLDRFDGFMLLIVFVYILKFFNFNFYFIV